MNLDGQVLVAVVAMEKWPQGDGGVQESNSNMEECSED